MKTSYILLLLCFIVGTLNAQQRTIHGQIIDQETQEPLVGVTVLEKGTTNGSFSNEIGGFQISVDKDSAIIVFSFIGYLNVEIPVYDSNDNINIQLTKNSLNIDEIVVTALNLKRESKDLGYSLQKLDSKSVAEVKSPNFVDNLAGQVAGVAVSQGATGVGSTSKITIRGEASFTNNNPLFIVDGTPINNNSSLNYSNAAAAGFQEVDFGNGAMDLNNDDIASVTVLKGPSAAALYGSRATNGVIIITTKDGTNNGQEKLNISFNSSLFLDMPFQLPKFQNQYGQGNSGKFEFVDGLGGGINDNISYSWGPQLDQGLMIPQFNSPVTLADGTEVRGGEVAVHGGRPISATPFVSNPNNLKNFYQTGITAINNIAISAAFDKGSYRLSLTDLRSKSFIPGVNLDRNTVAARLNFKPVQKLNISTSINYINSRSKNRPSSGYGSENINYSLVAWGPRSLNIADLKDYWQRGLEGVQQYSFNYTYFDNPYFILLENRNAFNRDRLLGNINASYDFTEHLSLLVGFGMDYSSEFRTFQRHFSSNRFKNGAYAEQEVLFREINSNFLLNYTRKVGNFGFQVSLGGNHMDQLNANKQTQALSLAQPGIFNFSNAASPLEVAQYRSQKRINSLYGLIKLSYKNFLYLDITGRNDWSSALASPSSTKNISFFYPSVSASFVLSNALELPSWFSFAKLRASWAQVGNDTDPYQTSGAFAAGVPYNSQPTFTAQNTIPNANLVPEITSAFEVGTDIRFLDDRFRLDFTYYNAQTSNQIISFPVAISSGYTQQVVNGGRVRSEGLEIMAGISPIRKKDFEWSMFFNFSHNVSTVEALPEGTDKITLAFSRVYDNVNQTVWFQVEEGGRIGDIYGTGYLKNENGDFVIDNKGNFIADNTLKKLGNYNPDFTLGFSNQIRYKNWDLSFLLDWRQGGQLVSRTLALAAVAGQLIETENRPTEGIIAEGVVNTGTTENPLWQTNTTSISAESYYRQYYDRNHEENNTYSASYIKLRQFSIGYTFKSSQDKGFFSKGRSLRIALIGRNLFALSNIPHFDPEQLAVQGNQFISGVEDMSYPSSRSFGLKLECNF